MNIEDAFKNIVTVSRQFLGTAEDHEKIGASLALIETILFPKKFETKKPEEEEVNP